MTDNPLQIRNSTAEFLIFTAQAGEQGIEVRCEDETVWLTQKTMVELFGVDVPTISEHLGTVPASSELQQDSVVRNFRNTAADALTQGPAFRDFRTTAVSLGRYR